MHLQQFSAKMGSALLIILLAGVAACYAAPEKFSGFGDDTQTTNGSLGIIGGSNAEVGELPWQVSFQYYNGRSFSHFCGGTIIGPRTIATAAHCCENMERYYLQIVAGASNLKLNEPTQQKIYVSALVMHPQYDSRTINYDVCKLTLVKDIDFSSSAVMQLPLCKQEAVSGQTCVISGWGSVDPSGQYGTDKLQKLFQPVTSRSTCQQNYGSGAITNAMICVGGKGGEGGCKGDSGGPMVCNIGGYCLAGATSWGQVPCGQQDRPTVYANMADPGIYNFFR